MNYASVGVGSVILFAGLAYFLSAKYWFPGPITNLNFNIEKTWCCYELFIRINKIK
jgi:hypothetical protein